MPNSQRPAINPLDHPVIFSQPVRVAFSAWAEHVPFGMLLVDLLRPRTIVELGTHYGVSYCAFCQSVKELGLNARCFAVDTWKGDPHAGFYGPEVLQDLRAHHDPLYGSFSRLVQASFDEAVAHFSENSIDLLHIDGLHTYEEVQHDFRTWFPRLSEQGVVLLHDINVRERDFGVWKLWEELSADYPAFSVPYAHGLGVLAVGPKSRPLLEPLLDMPEESLASFRGLCHQLGRQVALTYELSVARQSLLEASRQLEDESQKAQTAAGDQRSSYDALLRQLEQERDQAQAASREQRDSYEALLRQLEHEREQAQAASGAQRDLYEARLAQLEHEREQAQAASRAQRNSYEALLVTHNEIVASKVYRLGLRLREVRLHLLPLGTRREALARVLYRGLRTLRNEGWGSFWIKLKRKTGLRLSLGTMRRGPSDSLVRETSIPEVRAPSAPTPCTNSVEIVVCVHDALADVQPCLDSVLQFTRKPYGLIIVDDGSGQATRQFLRDFADGNDHVKLIINETARGYGRAANQGMQASTADLVILLNSDTVVSPDWVDRMAGAMFAHEKIGLVGPLSNTASWQSVPNLTENGDWAPNPLPEGIGLQEMARLVAQASAQLTPSVPLLNGFCMMLRRAMIEEIGYFDEENFGDGYGEEDDYVLRARSAGWKAVWADDTYVFHAQSRSYSHQSRRQLTERGLQRLYRKHGRARIANECRIMTEDHLLNGIRASNLALFAREAAVREGRQKFAGKRVLFLLPIASPGGGGNVVVSEAAAMLEMGVDVTLFNAVHNRASFLKAYPHLAMPVVFGEPPNVATLARLYDAVVATVHYTVEWLSLIGQKANQPVRAYYVQDFEPSFYTDTDSWGYRNAFQSYGLLPDLVRFTKTHWTAQQVRQHTGLHTQVIGIGYNSALFRPRRFSLPASQDRPLRVTAMVRPSTPYRNPELTLRVLGKIAHDYGDAVEIVAFGADLMALRSMNVTLDFPLLCAGELNQQQTANLLSGTDVFADLSSHQAMGLTALEAMACAAAVVVPAVGGAVEFAHDGENALVADTASEVDCYRKIKTLLDDEALRRKLQANALRDAVQYQPHAAALRILQTLFSAQQTA